MQLADVQAIVYQHYQLQGDLTSLPGELDLNFKLKTNTGEQYIIKLMRPQCEAALIDFQCAALLYLESRVEQVQLPKVIRSNNNQVFEQVTVDGAQRILWVLTYCTGHLLADFKPHTPKLMYSFGQSVAYLTKGFEGFEHSYMRRGLRWELTEALQVKDYGAAIQGPCREISQLIFERFETETAAILQDLPHSVIHNDANDYNVLVQLDLQGAARVDGVFDFGDMAYQPTICELAIALTYALMDKKYPLRMAYHFLKGYSKIYSISEAEISVLFQLIKLRLVVSIAISSHRQMEEPNDPYITISQEPAKRLLLQLDQIPEPLAESFFRRACDYPVTQDSEAVLAFLKKANPFPVMEVDNFEGILDLSVGSLLLGANPKATQLATLDQHIQSFMAERKIECSFGRYCESRRLYAAANFGASGHPTQEKRTNHLGIDIFTTAGSPVFAPFDGVVAINTVIDLPLDYGGLLILQHATDDGIPFYTLYGHLAPDSLTLSPGTKFKAGAPIAALGKPHENGGWPPHLHLQIITDLLWLDQEFPGVAFQEELDIWRALCPNPMLLFQVPDIQAYDAKAELAPLLKMRQEKLGYNLSLSYTEPLHIVSGFRQFLYDSHARTYLDFYNNVPHVGHQHPSVVKAIQQQAALLNTNTRYLHETILNYAERLTSKMPNHLEICYFVNSASEANELALRMARTYTQRKDIMVVESAYHGHTSTLIDISPYKHDGPGGQGTPDWVHKIPIADTYRGIYKKDDPQAGTKYAEAVGKQLQQLEAEGKSVAAFIAETYPSVGGQIIPPANYLSEVYQHARQHGALCIADEVQTGFGRLGKSYWAFETQQVLPDMVILGKPIANGFPLGALVTTKAIAEAFNNGMEYFSTFGGNPVSCAAGLAVMDVIESEQLQANAIQQGRIILEHFERLKSKYPLIGDVRGEGLFLGMELVKDSKTLEPAAAEATYVADRLKDFGILAGTDGPLHNVLKFRPSMGINASDVEFFVKALEEVLGETYLRK